MENSDEIKALKEELEKEKFIESKLKNQIKRLFVYDMITILFLMILGIFTLNIYSDLKSYENNLLFSTSEIKKIELFREEMKKDNNLILNSIKNTRFGEEIYFYFKYNESKKGVLELYSYKLKKDKLIEDKYLFDMEVN